MVAQEALKSATGTHLYGLRHEQRGCQSAHLISGAFRTKSRNRIDHFLVHSAVRCDEVRGRRIERRVVHAGNTAPCLLDDQGTGRDVPRLELLLPERLEASGGDITEVQRGGAEAADGARAAKEVAEQLDQLAGLLVHRVGKTGDEERVEQRPAL